MLRAVYEKNQRKKLGPAQSQTTLKLGARGLGELGNLNHAIGTLVGLFSPIYFHLQNVFNT